MNRHRMCASSPPLSFQPSNTHIYTCVCLYPCTPENTHPYPAEGSRLLRLRPLWQRVKCGRMIHHTTSHTPDHTTPQVCHTTNSTHQHTHDTPHTHHTHPTPTPHCRWRCSSGGPATCCTQAVRQLGGPGWMARSNTAPRPMVDPVNPLTRGCGHPYNVAGGAHHPTTQPTSHSCRLLTHAAPTQQQQVLLETGRNTEAETETETQPGRRKEHSLNNCVVRFLQPSGPIGTLCRMGAQQAHGLLWTHTAQGQPRSNTKGQGF
jgi:hypothetical protein